MAPRKVTKDSKQPSMLSYVTPSKKRKQPDAKSVSPLTSPKKSKKAAAAVIEANNNNNNNNNQIKQKQKSDNKENARAPTKRSGRISAKTSPVKTTPKKRGPKPKTEVKLIY